MISKINHSETAFFELLEKKKNIPEGESLFLQYGGKIEKIAIENCFVPARDGYKIPIRIFNSDIKTPGPILVFFPGGGYVSHMFEACAIAASRIAKYSNLKVILVDYRLALENLMPTPILDALDATKYIFNHADKFSLDPEKLLIGGFSIGAHCAAAISILAQKEKSLKIRQQILLNGAYDAFLLDREYKEYEDQDRMVSREIIKHIYSLWGLSDDQLRSPLYSPYYENNLHSMPDTLIVVGEFDGMRSDSEKYYLKLKEQGCAVTKTLLPGQCHHTMLLRGVLTDEPDPAKVIGRALREKRDS